MYQVSCVRPENGEKRQQQQSLPWVEKCILTGRAARPAFASAALRLAISCDKINLDFFVYDLKALFFEPLCCCGEVVPDGWGCCASGFASTRKPLFFHVALKTYRVTKPHAGKAVLGS